MKTPPAAGVQLKFSGMGLLKLQFTGDGLLLAVPLLQRFALWGILSNPGEK